MILGNANNRSKALKMIYKANKEKVEYYIMKNNGSQDEAKDIFQETMIAFYENVRDHKFKNESKISTYLYAIARFKWLNQLKKKGIVSSHYEQLEQDNEFNKNPLSKLILKEEQEQVIKVLSLLGDSCKHLLIESIYHGKSMKEITKEKEYTNEQVTRNKKYKCLKRLKEILFKQPQLIKILKVND